MPPGKIVEVTVTSADRVRDVIRNFSDDGFASHRSHKEQASMIRRHIIWRNQHAADERLRGIVTKANAV